ncbi:MAG: hypothetical protein V7646_1486 [Pseudonocardia sp.]
MATDYWASPSTAGSLRTQIRTSRSSSRKPEQHRGVASLLLEYLVPVAAGQRVRRPVADVLAINHDMFRVIADSGVPVIASRTVEPDGDVVHVVLDAPALTAAAHPMSGTSTPSWSARPDPTLQASAHPSPRSVVVIGADRRPESVGRIVLRRIVDGGFTGPVHVVNPYAAAVAGIPCGCSVSELPRRTRGPLCARGHGAGGGGAVRPWGCARRRDPGPPAGAIVTGPGLTGFRRRSRGGREADPPMLASPSVGVSVSVSSSPAPWSPCWPASPP